MQPHEVLLMLILVLPALFGLMTALAKWAWAERVTEQCGAWATAKRDSYRGIQRSWGQETSNTLLWPFQVLAGVTGRIPQSNWRAGMRMAVYAYATCFLVGLVAALLYVVIIVTLSLVALYLGFKLLMFVLSGQEKGGVSGSHREPTEASTGRGFWSSDPEALSSPHPTVASASGSGHPGSSSLWSSTRPCRACGATVSTDIEICPKCGEDQSTWKPLGTWERQCRVCGQTVSEDVEICQRCGENQGTWKPLGTREGPCRACGATVSEDVDVCPQCGEDKTTWKPLGTWERKCRVCGGVVSEDVEVCRHCGENQGTWKPLGTGERPCRACKAIVSEDVSRCPQCGEDLAAFKLFG